MMVNLYGGLGPPSNPWQSKHAEETRIGGKDVRSATYPRAALEVTGG